MNVELYENLVSMGFNRHSAATALKLSNNDLNLALQVSVALVCCSCSFSDANFSNMCDQLTVTHA